MPDEKLIRQKPFLVVLDLDDCIVSFMGALCRVHNKKYGTSITPSDLNSWDFNTLEVKDAQGNVVKGEELRKTFADYEAEGLYVGLPLLGASDQALEFMKNKGYRVVILTARDEKYGKQTELNLIFNRIYQYVDEVFFKADKVKKIQNLSKAYHIVMFADDKAETVQKVIQNCNVDHVFLIEQAHNENVEVDPDVKRVRDLLDTVRYLRYTK